MAHKMPHTTGDSTKYKAEVHIPAVDAYIAGGWSSLKGHVCPTIQGLAFQIGVSHATLLNWSKAYPEFGEKYSRLKMFCEISLVQGGLAGKLEAPITKLVLSHAHGYAEKTQVETILALNPETVIDSIKKMLGGKGDSK